MIYKLSASSLGLMKDCPRCFWLDKNEKWKRPEAIFSSLPNGMDRVLKKHFDVFRDKGKLPPELEKNKELEGVRLFGDNEEQKKLLEIWRNNKKGIVFKDSEGNMLVGAVDNVLIKGNKLIILDYKTRGYALKDDTHEHYRDQLDVYNFLLRENGFETEDYGYLLFYVPEKVLESGEVVFETKLIKMKTNPDNAKKLFEDALKLLKGKCPSRHSGEVCEWCYLVED
ncbi:MAG: PD-(D/E)XK nuclease family protein [Candidatus Pacearchaeota archaeon]|nr:PD-(D/E)XK nuclease family protein [Candidatus Pacearchaeota archaeon]